MWHSVRNTGALQDTSAAQHASIKSNHHGHLGLSDVVCYVIDIDYTAAAAACGRICYLVWMRRQHMTPDGVLAALNRHKPACLLEPLSTAENMRQCKARRGCSVTVLFCAVILLLLMLEWLHNCCWPSHRLQDMPHACNSNCNA